MIHSASLVRFSLTVKATNEGKILCLDPQVVALIISLPGNTFSIEISTGSEINEDLHISVEIQLGTPGGGLNKVSIFVFTPNLSLQNASNRKRD